MWGHGLVLPGVRRTGQREGAPGRGDRRHYSGFVEGTDLGSSWAGGACTMREANGQVTALIIVELLPLMLDASTAGCGRIVSVD